MEHRIFIDSKPRKEQFELAVELGVPETIVLLLGGFSYDLKLRQASFFSSCVTVLYYDSIGHTVSFDRQNYQIPNIKKLRELAFLDTVKRKARRKFPNG